MKGQWGVKMVQGKKVNVDRKTGERKVKSKMRVNGGKVKLKN
jgi:hypothetical protein